jgi:signal transduction histidine kinase
MMTIPYLIFAMGGLFTFIDWKGSCQISKDTQLVQFQRDVERATTAIASRYRDIENSLRLGQSVLASNIGRHNGHWKIFARAVLNDSKSNSITGLGMISGADFGRWCILLRDGREIYKPVTELIQNPGHLQMLQLALKQSRRSRSTCLTGRMFMPRLLTGPGLVLTYPIQPTADSTAMPESFVAVISLEDLFRDIYHRHLANMGLEILDAQAVRDQITPHTGFLFRAKRPRESLLEDKRTLTLGGRVWILSFFSRPTYVLQAGQSSILNVLRDLIITFFIAYLARRAMTTQARIHSLREEVLLRQSEKMSALGRLAAGVAHELNNPLTGIMGFSELLLQRETVPPTWREDLATIYQQSQRCRRIILNLLRFSRREVSKKEPVDLNALLESTLQMIRYDFLTSGIELVTVPSATSLIVAGDANQIQQVFLNLITNARQAMAQSSIRRLEIAIEQKTGSVFVHFEDTGNGIQKDILARVFEPFFTTKAPGEGTGLGLSICHGILEEHGGDLIVESQEGRGSRFTVQLPITGA